MCGQKNAQVRNAHVPYSDINLQGLRICVCTSNFKEYRSYELKFLMRGIQSLMIHRYFLVKCLDTVAMR